MRILADNVRETMNRSYVVKIGDFMVNLENEEEIILDESGMEAAKKPLEQMLVLAAK